MHGSLFRINYEFAAILSAPPGTSVPYAYEPCDDVAPAPTTKTCSPIEPGRPFRFGHDGVCPCAALSGPNCNRRDCCRCDHAPAPAQTSSKRANQGPALHGKRPKWAVVTRDRALVVSRLLGETRKPILSHPLSVQYMRARKKANSCMQPSIFDMLAGASPASAMDGWAAVGTV